MPFDFTLEYRVIFKSGRDTILRLRHYNSLHAYTFKINEKVNYVFVDPEYKTLKKVKGVQRVKDGFKANQVLRIYPNPSSEQFIIESKEENITFTAILYDASGNRMLELPKSRGSAVLNVSKLSPSSYQLVVDVEGTIVSYKLIKT